MHYALTRIIGTDGYGSMIATKRLISMLRKRAVDTVYIVSVYGHYLNENALLKYLIREKIRVVYIMIDEYAFSGGCAYAGECRGYQEKCAHCQKNNVNPLAQIVKAAHRRYMSRQAYYRQLNDPVFVGPEFTLMMAERTGLLSGMRSRILDEAIDTQLYKPQDTRQFRQSLNIPEDKIVIVCVAPYSYERKGVRYFYELAERMQADDRYAFVHVGFDGKRDKFPSNMVVKGYERDQRVLSMYYSLADLFVFPSLLDTMPNACLEALSCGTPLLCFDISGMPYIANREVASFVEPGNVDRMVDIVRQTEKKDETVVSKCREYALNRYDSRKYHQMLEELGK